MAPVLVELAVRNLGVIPDARIPMGSGLVALTGETGAGKTMVVEALNLLTGGRPDPSRVRTGATEAVVEGLFVVDDTEWVLRRCVPASGRSRAYVNGELATAAALAELGAVLLELHGQHAQQALLGARAQRDALDLFAGADRGPVERARRAVREATERLDALGGDERTRARELDLIRYELDEIDGVGPVDGEDERLATDEDLLGAAVDHRDAAAQAAAMLGTDGGAADAVARATARLEGGAPFGGLVERLVALNAEITDCAAELRSLADTIEPDEERLAEIRSRRDQLVQLRRKYGPTISEVLERRTELAGRLEELESVDEARGRCDADLAAAGDELARAADELGRRRRAAAPELAAAVEEQLRDLALPAAVVQVRVEDAPALPGAGGEVEFILSTNPGVPASGLARVASGGELSRVMLALRLVLSEGPPTMVFDEVDAGIGGEAAVAVGRALARLAQGRQVLVVTHLAQVAAFADHQLRVDKGVDPDGLATTTVEAVGHEERIVELSRMLSGSPDSAAARDHAAELLDAAAAGRDPSRAR